ncbi:MAG: LON peptidase substrate-binding domain-containing protein [Alphaproteobacteria bacterium]|nr:LON peptidase substrate-binding domain-containing protein [Alphaproteobacteria bacterium]
MPSSFFDISMDEMPSIIPIMPYNTSILMPTGKVSLRLYETRHFNMIFDALASQRIIGLIQSMEPVFDFSPTLYSVGCAGRISAFSEGDNNSMMATITGICRFTMVTELKRPRGYRQAKVDYSRFGNDAKLQPNTIDRKALFPVLENFVRQNNLDVTAKMLSGMNDAKLLSTLAMLLPFESRERQLLLEAENLNAMAETLIALLKIGNQVKHE